MRSITYILTGKPGNLADSLDYASKHELQRIILTLHHREEVTEQYVVRWLYASYTWIFADRAVSYEVTYGGCFQHESKERQRLSVDNANMRIEKDLDLIRGRVRAKEFEGQQHRFDYGLTY